MAPKEACGQAYNIAFGERFTVNQMYDLMCQLLDVDMKPIYTEPRAGDIMHSLADISKAERLLGYKPDWNFTDGFTEATKWYKENL